MCILGEFELTLLIIKEKVTSSINIWCIHAHMKTHIYTSTWVCAHTHIVMKQDNNIPNITEFFSNTV